eukprot:8612397-Lingulodinium_polyedra.AAC.1
MVPVGAWWRRRRRSGRRRRLNGVRGQACGRGHVMTTSTNSQSMVVRGRAMPIAGRIPSFRLFCPTTSNQSRAKAVRRNA